MNIFIKLIVQVLAVMIAAYIVPGVQMPSFWTAVVFVVVLGILNTFIKPIILLFTLPITILTLGLFTLVINTLLIFLASSLVQGFAIASFWSALLFSIVLSITNSFLYSLAK